MRVKEQVAVVIPIYRLPLTPEEELSLDHVRHFLSAYSCYVVAPRSLAIPPQLVSGMSVIRFPDVYFADLNGYNRLMLSHSFYNVFDSYEYILIYQLDCLVFACDLEKWCKRGWDYVGAPWFKGHRDDTREGFWAVGNGGLSLRRIKAFKKVLNARGLWQSPMKLARETGRFSNYPMLREFFIYLKAFVHWLGYKNTIRYYIAHFSEYEDLFWSFQACKIDPGFEIATPEEALAFSFEYAPRYCLERNGGRLPFGCHGWYKIDDAFWRPFLFNSRKSTASEEQ